jgi:hypothetical protein
MRNIVLPDLRMPKLRDIKVLETKRFVHRFFPAGHDENN